MIDLNEVLDTTGKRIELGVYCVARGDKQTGLSLFQSASDLEPDNIEALVNTAAVLIGMKEYEAAEVFTRRALKVDPNHAHVLGTMAQIEQQKGDYVAAKQYFCESLKSDQNNATTLLNYAYMLQLGGDFYGALSAYTRVRDINPMDFSARFQRSMCMLTIADSPDEWREALDEYEIRRMLMKFAAVSPTPQYTGQIDTKAAVLLICEQGLGDAVMMARYIRQLVGERVGRVYIHCNKNWVWLMSKVEGVSGVFSDISEVPPHDYHMPMMSLMRAGFTPSRFYDKAKYLKVYSAGQNQDKYKIGLCWQGNPEHGNDRYRSIHSTEFWKYLGGIENVEFISLQTPEVNAVSMPPVVTEANLPTVQKLAETIAGLDMVVTVDTAILHIAGALGIPTIALIPSNPDWRWRTVDAATPWYPTVQLVRAKRPLDWDDALEKAAQKVKTRIKAAGVHNEA